MTQQNPTAADFFAQPHEDDTDEAPELVPPFQLVSMGHFKALAEDVDLLRRQVTHLVTMMRDPEAALLERELASTDIDHAGTSEQLYSTQEELADTEAKLQTLTQVVVDIEAALGKSTAKPALAAKAVIEEYRNPKIEEPEEGEDVVDPGPLPEPIQPQGDLGYVGGQLTTDTGPVTINEPEAPVSQAPANDAPVEEWREYARAQGFAGPDIDKANRSQIRTALGIAQPVTPQAGA